MSESQPSITILKRQAKRLRAQLDAMGTRINHSQSLELVAQQYAHRDWNTICASAQENPDLPVSVGDRVRGRYLSKPFTARVIGVTILKPTRFRISIEFDEALDVVIFDSFSNKRKRVTCVIDSSGVTKEKTSDGMPHLALEPRS